MSKKKKKKSSSILEKVFVGQIPLQKDGTQIVQPIIQEESQKIQRVEVTNTVGLKPVGVLYDSLIDSYESWSGGTGAFGNTATLDSVTTEHKYQIRAISISIGCIHDSVPCQARIRVRIGNHTFYAQTGYGILASANVNIIFDELFYEIPFGTLIDVERFIISTGQAKCYFTYQILVEKINQ
jgi:hypothetical protein